MRWLWVNLGAAGGGIVDWVGAQSGDPSDEGDDEGDVDEKGDLQSGDAMAFPKDQE